MTNEEKNLTPRQRDVLNLLASGCLHKTIAERLGIAKSTVSEHVEAVVKRLGARNSVHAVAIATARGLLEDPE